MSLALRPYMNAGVALVGASVIAVTPVAAPAPAIQTHAIQLTTAIDNPLNVFAPVVTQLGTGIRNAIQAELDNPFPIINGLIGHAAIDIQTLGKIGNALGTAWAPVLTDFPPALAEAGRLAASGNFTGALNRFQGVFMGPVWNTLFPILDFMKLIRNEFATAGNVAADLAWLPIDMTYGQMMNLFGPLTAVTGTLDSLWRAVPSGDPGKIVNAVQHGMANIAVAVLKFADNFRQALQGRRLQIGTDLNPPPPDPEFPDLAARTDTTKLTLAAPPPETTEKVGTTTRSATQSAGTGATGTPATPAANVTDIAPATPAISAKPDATESPIKVSVIDASDVNNAPPEANTPVSKASSDTKGGSSATSTKDEGSKDTSSSNSPVATDKSAASVTSDTSTKIAKPTTPAKRVKPTKPTKAHAEKADTGNGTNTSHKASSESAK